MTGALQIVTVSDYHYSKVSLKNNADNTVKEGQTFILVASVNTTLKDDLTITVTPKAGEEERYENLPSELVIPCRIELDRKCPGYYEERCEYDRR